MSTLVLFLPDRDILEAWPPCTRYDRGNQFMFQTWGTGCSARGSVNDDLDKYGNLMTVYHFSSFSALSCSLMTF